MGLFIPKPGFERAVLRAGFVKRHVEKLAEKGAEAYREGVPVHEGDLKESVFSDVALTPEGFRGRFGAKDWKAGLVELGTARTRPNGALRRAAESLGIPFERTRR